MPVAHVQAVWGWHFILSLSIKGFTGGEEELDSRFFMKTPDINKVM